MDMRILMTGGLLVMAGLAGCAARNRPSTLLPSASPPVANAFQITYETRVPPDVRMVVEEAARRWTALLVIPVPIRVRIGWIEGVGPNGFAWPNLVREVTASGQPVDVPSALADARAGRDVQPGFDDMNIFFKAVKGRHFDFEKPVPRGKTDFLTVVMHEFGHGLGLSTAAFVPWEAPFEASIGLPNEFVNFFDFSFPVPPRDGVPTLFDTHVYDATGTPVSKLRNPSRRLYNALTGPISFRGPASEAAFGGPVPLDRGSVSHISREALQSTDPDWQMAPETGMSVAQHDPGPLTLAMLVDLGWTLRDSQAAK